MGTDFAHTMTRLEDDLILAGIGLLSIVLIAFAVWFGCWCNGQSGIRDGCQSVTKTSPVTFSANECSPRVVTRVEDLEGIKQLEITPSKKPMHRQISLATESGSTAWSFDDHLFFWSSTEVCTKL